MGLEPDGPPSPRPSTQPTNDEPQRFFAPQANLQDSPPMASRHPTRAANPRKIRPPDETEWVSSPQSGSEGFAR